MEKTESVIREVLPGKLNALVKNLMSQMKTDNPNEAVRRINSGEWVVSPPTRPWREEKGIIYLSVTSDGTTGPQWKERLEKNGFQVSDGVQSVLYSETFKPTFGVTTEIGVLKGKLFTDNDRFAKNIRLKAIKNKMTLLNAEVACLIREKFSDKDMEEMGLLWIVVMHKPINNSSGNPCLLRSGRHSIGRRLDVCDGKLAYWWFHDDGFAFACGERSRTACGERSRTACGERSRTACSERSRTVVSQTQM